METIFSHSFTHKDGRKAAVAIKNTDNQFETSWTEGDTVERWYRGNQWQHMLLSFRAELAEKSAAGWLPDLSAEETTIEFQPDND